MAKKKSNVDVVRAWKDASYRNSLSAAQRAMLPANPAGLVQVDDAELGAIDGGVDIQSNGCTIVVIEAKKCRKTQSVSRTAQLALRAPRA